MNPTILILDLDGVLITTPPWKQDKIHQDGYSDFELECVNNLNTLLKAQNFEIWLSSTRRSTKTIEEFNRIFKNRNIEGDIIGFVPISGERITRKEELEEFISANGIIDYLIIDDDQSLHDFQESSKLVLTSLQIGFNKEKLKEAKLKLIRKGL